MKITDFIVSMAALLLALPLVSAAREAPTEGDEARVTPAAEHQPLVVPEPDVAAAEEARDAPSAKPLRPVDPPLDDLATAGEPLPRQWPCSPVVSHLTAAGSGERCCSRCGRSCDGRSGWWRGRIRPCLQCSHWGYADLFEELPAGAAVHAHKKVQVTLAMRARMVLYRYDFHDEATSKAAQLNRHGERRLASIARMSQDTGLYPIRIEPVPERQGLNTARRAYVLQQLQQSSFAVPEEWVVVASPDAPVLAGEEAVEIQKNLLKHTQSGPESRSGSGQSGISGIVVGGQ